MGYGYDSNRRLVCDHCGTSGGVRRRKCPYTVSSASRPGDRAHSLPYCPAPALCAPCYLSLGGLRGVHGDSCAEGARASQDREDAKQARLATGDYHVVCRYGTWEDMPKTHIRAVYQNRRGGQVWVTIPAEYSRVDWLRDLPAEYAQA